MKQTRKYGSGESKKIRSRIYSDADPPWEGCQIDMRESCVCGREPITTSQLFPEQWRIIVGLAQLEKQNMA